MIQAERETFSHITLQELMVKEEDNNYYKDQIFFTI